MLVPIDIVYYGNNARWSASSRAIRTGLQMISFSKTQLNLRWVALRFFTDEPVMENHTNHILVIKRQIYVEALVFEPIIMKKINLYSLYHLAEWKLKWNRMVSENAQRQCVTEKKRQTCGIIRHAVFPFTLVLFIRNSRKRQPHQETDCMGSAYMS